MPENTKPDLSSLAAETVSGSDSAERLPARIERYSKAKFRATEMRDFLRSSREDELAKKLASCGNWLVFNHYYTVDKVRLAHGSFCHKHLLCPLCAIRRGSKQLKAYLDRLEVIQQENPGLQISMVTLTVKNGPDLLERLEHLYDSLKTLNQRRRNSIRGGHGGHDSEWSKVLGLVGTYEFTRNQDSKEWHPHCHIIVLHREEISEPHLTHEWHSITGDSFVLDVTPALHPDDPALDFIEVFKYAIKFSDLSLEDNVRAFHLLMGRRLIFSAGLFYGVNVPKGLLDELPLDDLPFVQLFYSYLHGAGYQFLKKGGDAAK